MGEEKKDFWLYQLRPLPLHPPLNCTSEGKRERSFTKQSSLGRRKRRRRKKASLSSCCFFFDKSVTIDQAVKKVEEEDEEEVSIAFRSILLHKPSLTPLTPTPHSSLLPFLFFATLPLFSSLLKVVSASPL